MLSRLEDMRRTCTNLPPTPPGFVFSPQPASKRNGNVQIQFLHRKLVLSGSIESISPSCSSGYCFISICCWQGGVDFNVATVRVLFSHKRCQVVAAVEIWVAIQQQQGFVRVTVKHPSLLFFFICVFIHMISKKLNRFLSVRYYIYIDQKSPPSSTNRKQARITKYLPLPSPETCHTAQSSSVTSSPIGSHPGISTYPYLIFVTNPTNIFV